MSRLLLASLLVALTVLAGCGSAPPRVGSAAIVGDQVITVEDLQARVQSVVPVLQAAADQQGGVNGQVGAPLPADFLAEESRRILSVRVLHTLIGIQAQRDGLRADPAAAEATLAAAGGVQRVQLQTGYDEGTVRDLAADQALGADIGRRTFDQLSVTLDYADAPNRAAAEALAARVVADPAGAGALFTGNGGATGLTLRPGAAETGAVRTSASSVLFGVPEGTVAITPGGSSSAQQQGADPSQQPWTVVHVTRRAFDAPPPGPGVTPVAQVDPQTLFAFGVRQLQPLALELGVTVNPRYGTWDPTQLDLVENPAAAGAITPVRSAAP